MLAKVITGAVLRTSFVPLRSQRYPRAIRLNDKTVTIECEHQHWRVSYSLLHRVLDSDANVVAGVEILGPPVGRASSGDR
jgi:hypothetical protein